MLNEGLLPEKKNLSEMHTYVSLGEAILVSSQCLLKMGTYSTTTTKSRGATLSKLHYITFHGMRASVNKNSVNWTLQCLPNWPVVFPFFCLSLSFQFTSATLAYQGEPSPLGLKSAVKPLIRNPCLANIVSPECWEEHRGWTMWRDFLGTTQNAILQTLESLLNQLHRATF